MKITDVTTEVFRWPRHKPISNGKHTYTHTGLSLVKVSTDEAPLVSASAPSTRSSRPPSST